MPDSNDLYLIDPFEEWDRQQDAIKVKEYKRVIKRARKMADDFSACDFVESCAKFLKKRGFLTSKQVNALGDVSVRSFSFMYTDDYDDFERDELESLLQEGL